MKHIQAQKITHFDWCMKNLHRSVWRQNSASPSEVLGADGELESQTSRVCLQKAIWNISQQVSQASRIKLPTEGLMKYFLTGTWLFHYFIAYNAYEFSSLSVIKHVLNFPSFGIKHCSKKLNFFKYSNVLKNLLSQTCFLNLESNQLEYRYN